MHRLILLVWFIAAGEQSARTDIPPGLQRMIKSRLAITHADVEWTRADSLDANSGGQPIRFRSMIAGEDRALINYGTPDGIAAWTERGEPVLDSRESYLQHGSELWDLRNDLVWATLETEAQRDDYHHSDVRQVGLFPIPITLGEPETNLSQLLAHAGLSRFSETRLADGLVAIDAESTEEPERIRWIIDPKLDWHPLRVQLFHEDRLVIECQTEYERVDSRWFPKTARYFDSAQNLATEMDIERAALNRDDLPRELTPEAIGMGTGFTINVTHRGVPEADSRTYVEGMGPLFDEEFARLYVAKQITVDPRLAERDRIIREREAARNAGAHEAASRADKPGSASRPSVIPNAVDDEWEKYTHEFIRRFKLDPEQSQRALAILHDCQERRSAYVKSREDRIRAIQERLLKSLPGERKDLPRELESLLTPIKRIFDEQLKPRLENLPTRAQRATAQSQPSP